MNKFSKKSKLKKPKKSLKAAVMKMRRRAELKSQKVAAAPIKHKQTNTEKRVSVLEGAKFRMLNEDLYTTKGEDSFEEFKKNPELFKTYHQGFSDQVEKWPLNPVDMFVEKLIDFPKAVVADFGCGEAKIAQTVSNEVRSFDLVAHNEHVEACNIAHVPLKDKSVNIAVFSLSLMGTDFADFLKEAHRVLVKNGLLWIAEVRSRFRDDKGIKTFVSMLEAMGFESKSVKTDDKDCKMFVLFEFRKKSNKIGNYKKFNFTFKACEYKRR